MDSFEHVWYGWLNLSFALHVQEKLKAMQDTERLLRQEVDHLQSTKTTFVAQVRKHEVFALTGLLCVLACSPVVFGWEKGSECDVSSCLGAALLASTGSSRNFPE